MARREHPRYENMEWPDWEFREYPMMVYPGAKDPRKPEYEVADRGRNRGRTVLRFPGVVVKNDEELKAVLDGSAEFNPTSGEILTEEDSRQALIRECMTQGLQIDKRWGVEKLQKALDDHIEALGQPEVV